MHIRALYNMHAFLTRNINFETFPCSMSKYIEDMSIQIFKEILQNISTCISLYGLSKRGMYNHRAISTLANESFFSNFTFMDKEGLGTPMLVNILKLIRKVMQLNYYKHTPSK